MLTHNTKQTQTQSLLTVQHFVQPNQLQLQLSQKTAIVSKLNKEHLSLRANMLSDSQPCSVTHRTELLVSPLFPPPPPPRWSLPFHGTREAEPGHGLHPLPFPGSTADYCWPALLGLAGRPGPVWPWLAGWWQCPLSHQRPEEELRRRRAWGADSLQQSQPYRIPRNHCPVRRLLLPRYTWALWWWSRCNIIVVIGLAMMRGRIWGLTSLSGF